MTIIVIGGLIIGAIITLFEALLNVANKRSGR